MIDFAPPLAFVPSPVFLPAPAPLAPPIGVPGLPGVPDPSGLPGFLQPFPIPALPGTEVEAFVPSGVPDLPLIPAFPREGIGGGDVQVEEIPPSFEGGQSQGVLYRVSGEVRFRISAQFNCPGFGPWEAFGPTNVLGPTGPAVGPIAGVRETRTPDPNTPNTALQRWVVDTAVGQRSINLRGSPARGYYIPCGPAYELRNVRFTRQDGLPDTGGDPPPERPAALAPNPARAFQPNRIRPFRRPQPRPRVLPEVDPRPQEPSLPPTPETPEVDPARRPDRRVPGPPLPIGPVTPPEVVPFEPGTLPDLPVVPQLPPVTEPKPPVDPERRVVPELPPLRGPVLEPPFTPLPPGTPTKEPVPPVVVIPPPTRIPPPVVIDCCAVPEVIRQGDRIRRELERLRRDGGDECVDLCKPAVMLDVVCEGGLGLPIRTREQAVTVTTLSGALGRLSRQVFEIARYLNICDTFPEGDKPPMGCTGPGLVGSAVYQGSPPPRGIRVSFGEPEEGRMWVGAVARYLANSGVGAIPSTTAPNAAYTRVVGNLSLDYGSVLGEARQVRSEWIESIAPSGAPIPVGVFASAMPQSILTIFPVSVKVSSEPNEE